MTSRGKKKTLKRKKGASAPFLVRRWRTLVGVVFAVVGVVGLLIPFVSFTIASPEDVLLAGQPLGASQGGTSVDVSQAHVTDRLVIGEFGIDMPIFTGELWASLERGAWLMGGTQPGEKGNTVIFGHRFKYLPPLSNTMFRLGGIEHGDTFTVNWKGQDRLYRVFEKRIVTPDQVSVVAPTDDERITLVTCNPVWSTKERLIVVGFPVDQ